MNKTSAHHIEKVKEWQRANPDKVRRYKRASKQRVRAERPWQWLLYSAKSRAKALGVPFDLTPDWAADRWTGKCELTKESFDVSSKPNGEMYSPSIDRVDPQGGYTQDNCRFILWAVNRFKANSSDEVMYRLARAITENK